MTGEAKKNDSGYMGFEYREITVSKKYIYIWTVIRVSVGSRIQIGGQRQGTAHQPL